MKSSPLAGCHIRFLCFTTLLNFMNDSLKYFKVSLITKTHLPNVFLFALHLWQFWIQNHLGDRPLDMSLSVHRGTYPQCCWYYSKAELFDPIKGKYKLAPEFISLYFLTDGSVWLVTYLTLWLRCLSALWTLVSPSLCQFCKTTPIARRKQKTTLIHTDSFFLSHE